MDRVFEIQIVQPNFDKFYSEMESKVYRQSSDKNLMVAILLNQQFQSQEVYFSKPSSNEAIEWVSKTKQLIAKVNFDMAQLFATATSKYESIISIPYRKIGAIELAKSNILKQILEAKAYLELSDENIKELRTEIIYKGGDPYAFIRGVVLIIKEAAEKIFYIDPYMDDDVFNLFFSQIKGGIKIEIIVDKKTSKLNSKIISAFKTSNPAINLNIKKSEEIHDRVIFADNRCWVMGQSTNKAAESKPTYIVEINNVSAMKNVYDDIWKRAVSI